MTVEDMAREAGGYPPNQHRNFWEFLPEHLASFVALVRRQALEDAARVVLELRADGYCADMIRALPDYPSGG